MEKFLIKRWIPVTEQMPRDCLYVLVSTADGDVELAYHDASAWHFISFGYAVPDDRTDADRVTAWMPLPEAYKEAK